MALDLVASADEPVPVYLPSDPAIKAHNDEAALLEYMRTGASGALRIGPGAVEIEMCAADTPIKTYAVRKARSLAGDDADAFESHFALWLSALSVKSIAGLADRPLTEHGFEVYPVKTLRRVKLLSEIAHHAFRLAGLGTDPKGQSSDSPPPDPGRDSSGSGAAPTASKSRGSRRSAGTAADPSAPS